MKAARQRHRGHELRGGGTEWSRLRLVAGLSITELARAAGLSRSIVGFIDQGRMIPTPDEAAVLIRVLGVKPPAMPAAESTPQSKEDIL